MEASFIESQVPTPPRATLSLKPALKKRSGLATPAPPAASFNAPPATIAAHGARPRKLAFAATTPGPSTSWESQQQSLRANALSAIRLALGNEDKRAPSPDSQPESPTASGSASGPTLLASTAVMLAEAKRQEEREAKRVRKEDKRVAKEKRKLDGGAEQGERKKAKSSDDKAEKKSKKGKGKEKEKEGKDKAEKEGKKEGKKDKARRKSAPAPATEIPDKEEGKKRRASAVETVQLAAHSSPPTSTTPTPPPPKTREKRKRAPSVAEPAATSASVLAKFMAQAKTAEEERQQQESADRAGRDLAALADREAEAKERKAKAARKAEKRSESELGVATLAAAIDGHATRTVAAEPAAHKKPPVKRATRKARAVTSESPSEAGQSGEASTAVGTVRKAAVAERRENLREARNDRKAAEYNTPEQRARLQDPTALNEFLAGSWIEIPVLQKLEADGVITYKRGKFAEAEKTAVRDHLEAFKTIHNISHTELIDIMTSKGRSAERGSYPGFWSEIAQQVPGRPVRYVKEAVMRIYHPSAHKGKWTAEEDRSLLQAFELNPNAWGPISETIGRTITDCRDRWRGQLRDAAQRRTGSWSDEEVEALTSAVGTAMAQLGADLLDPDVPWEIVLDLMGRTRTLTQCRKKWTESVAPRLKGAASKVSRMAMVATIRKLNYDSPKDIQWTEVAEEMGVMRSPLSSRWMSMVRLVWPDGLPETHSFSMSTILSRIEEALADRQKVAMNGGRSTRLQSSKSRAYIEDSDDDDYLVPFKGKDGDKEVAKAVAATFALQDEDTRLEELALAAEEGDDDDE